MMGAKSITSLMTMLLLAKDSYARQCHVCLPGINGEGTLQVAISAVKTSITASLSSSNGLRDCPVEDFNATAAAFKVTCPGDDNVCAIMEGEGWKGRGCLPDVDRADGCYGMTGYRICYCSSDLCNANGGGNVTPFAAILFVSVLVSILKGM